MAGAAEDGLLDRLVFGSGQAAIREVWVAGRAVVADGHHRHEQQAAAHFTEWSRRQRSPGT
jgi:formimidoylglutamate deiminase